jgi:hypothetical protein
MPNDWPRSRRRAPHHAASETAHAIRVVAALVVLVVASCNRGVTAPTGVPAPTPVDPRRAEAFLDTLEQRTFQWFWDTTDPRTGLTPDRWPARTFSSVAAIGFALTAYPIGVERSYVSRQAAAERTLSTLRFLWQLPQGEAATGVSGYRGFFYHFLDYERGHRFETVELSTIDTSLLLGGVLFCQSYFTGSTADEVSIRAHADSLYRRVDWAWARNRPPAVSMGWKPGEGFLQSDWHGYNEAMILYVLALGSPTFSVEPAAWDEWTKSYRWAEFYGQRHVNFDPLFGHQYSHVWIDFRGIRDGYMRGKGIDYFENSRRATLSQRAYALTNPQRWVGYGTNEWGLTASDGPADGRATVDGVDREFHTYWARGVAAGEIHDDGTIAPTAVGGSVPFAPEITIPALIAMREKYGDRLFTKYGFLDAFNATFPKTGLTPQTGTVAPGTAWFDSDYLGIDQGPIIAMIENHRTGLIWRVMRTNPYIKTGLKRAGFTGGWLDQ